MRTKELSQRRDFILGKILDEKRIPLNQFYAQRNAFNVFAVNLIKRHADNENDVKKKIFIICDYYSKSFPEMMKAADFYIKKANECLIILGD